MKSDITDKLKDLLIRKVLDKSIDLFVFDCILGFRGRYTLGCINYNGSGEFIVYEFRGTAEEFRARNKATVNLFVGDKNYYVFPYEVYEEVCHELPPEIGVMIACDKKAAVETDDYGRKRNVLQNLPGFSELACVRNCTKRFLRADKELLLSSMLRSACRDRARGSLFPKQEENLKWNTK